LGSDSGDFDVIRPILVLTIFLEVLCLDYQATIPAVSFPLLFAVPISAANSTLSADRSQPKIIRQKMEEKKEK
jgi:hypothetical protein